MNTRTKQIFLLALTYLMLSFFRTSWAEESKGPVDPNSLGPVKAASQAEAKAKNAEVNETASKVKAVAGAGFATAAVGCASECFSSAAAGGMACSGLSIAATGGDTAADLITGAKAQDVMGKLGDQAKGVFGSFGKSLAGGAAKEATAEETAEATSGACAGIATNGVQSGISFVTAQTSAQNAKSERKDAKLLRTVRATGDMTDAGSGAADGAGAGLPNISEEAGGLPSADSAELAALGEQMGLGDNFRNFENMTGKPITELFDRMKAGQNPTAAAAEMAKDAIGGSATQALGGVANATDQLKGQILEALPKEFQANPGSETAFVSTASKSSRASKDNSLTAIGNLVSSLMPKKEEKEKNANVKALRLPASGKGAKLSGDGFMDAGKSLFDVIGARYQVISQQFEKGGAAISTSASAEYVPTNPYLKK